MILSSLGYALKHFWFVETHRCRWHPVTKTSRLLNSQQSTGQLLAERINWNKMSIMRLTNPGREQRSTQLNGHQNPLEDLLKYGVGLHPSFQYSRCGVDFRICFSNKFVGDAEAVRPRTTLLTVLALVLAPFKLLFRIPTCWRRQLIHLSLEYSDTISAHKRRKQEAPFKQREFPET